MNVLLKQLIPSNFGHPTHSGRPRITVGWSVISSHSVYRVWRATPTLVNAGDAGDALLFTELSRSIYKGRCDPELIRTQENLHFFSGLKERGRTETQRKVETRTRKCRRYKEESKRKTKSRNEEGRVETKKEKSKKYKEISRNKINT